MIVMVVVVVFDISIIYFPDGLDQHVYPVAHHGGGGASSLLRDSNRPFQQILVGLEVYGTCPWKEHQSPLLTCMPMT